MTIDKAIIEKITPRFEFKALVELKAGCWREETLALRGLDVPGHRSKKGRPLD